MPASLKASQSPAYQLFVLALSLYALGALAVQTILPLGSGTRQLLNYADYGVCALFFMDFIAQLVRAPSRWAYFRRWGWLDLLSSVPMVDAFRVSRVARVVRILRVLRGVRSTKLIASLILERRAQGAFLAAALLSILLVIFASIAILQLELTVEDSNIKSAGDALWWSMATITTVGYGDRYPVTPEGRIVAGILMLGGVGLFGTLSGFIASWFLAAPRDDHGRELELLRAEIAELRRTIAHR